MLKRSGTQKKAGKNLRYNRGAAYERRVKSYFMEHGFTINRSAGSHGVFDHIGFDSNATWAIQDKSGATRVQAQKLLEELTEQMKEQYPVLLHPLVVAVFYGWEGKNPLGVHNVLVPQVEKTDEPATKTTK